MHDSPHSQSTVASELTAADRGAVSVVGLHGPNALSMIEACFQPTTRNTTTPFPIGMIRYGTWISPTSVDRSTHSHSIVGESLLVVAVEDSAFEIHCHGGRAAVGSIIKDLSACGAEIVGWDKWIQTSRPSEPDAQLWEIVARTKTTITTAIALAQARGALRSWAGQLLDSIASEGVSTNNALNQSDSQILSMIRSSALKVLDRAPLGRHLVEPWKIVIAGPPNVGKSSLINRLLGYQRAITYDQAGTTRDVVTATSALHGWPVLLSDTAGIRETNDPLESEGVQRATQALRDAHVVLGVFDIREGMKSLSNCLPANLDVPVILVANKVDLVADDVLAHDHPPETLSISATNGQGIPELIQAIVRTWTPEEIPPGTPVPLLDRQRHALTALSMAQDLDEAEQILKEIALPSSQNPKSRPIIHNIL